MIKWYWNGSPIWGFTSAGYYFWDEVQHYAYGPYILKYLAKLAMKKYSKELEK